MKDSLGQLRLRFAGLHLVQERLHGQVYAGKDFSGNDVMVAVLGEQAAADPELRRAFAEAVQQLAGSGARMVHAADVHAAVPWAATREQAGLAIAERLVGGLSGRTGAVTPAGDPLLAVDPLPVADPLPVTDALPLPVPPSFSQSPSFSQPLSSSQSPVFSQPPSSSQSPVFSQPPADALSSVDMSAPVRPDPTFATVDPPVQPFPPGQVVPPAGVFPPQRAGPPAQPAAPVRPAQPTQPPAPTPYRPQYAAPRPPPAAPARRLGAGTPAGAIVAVVVIGALLLMVCCSAVATAF